MRLSIIIFGLILSGCATQDAELRACTRYLPPAHYAVIDRATFRSDAIVKVVRGEARKEQSISIPNYEIPWSLLSSAYRPQPKTFILLHGKPDELVLCEINASGCAPSFTWLTAEDKTSEYRVWNVSKKVEGECILY